MKKLGVIMIFCLLFATVLTAVDAKKESGMKKFLKEGRTQMVKYFKDGDLKAYEKAVFNYKNILENDPEGKDGALIMLANLYMRRSNQIINVLDKKEFKNKRSHFAVGNLLLTQRKFKKALKHYDICSKAFPKWACPLRHKGEALLEIGESAEAVKVLKHCVSVRAKHFDAYVYLARALVAEKEYRKAEKVVDQAIECLKEDKGCGDDGEMEAYPEDCTKLYIEIYEHLKDYKKVKFYKEKLQKNK